MTYLNTQQTLQFIQRNDRNGNGLSKNELMQGAMQSCMKMMHSMSTGNQQGVMEAFQSLATATQLANSFDILSQASGKFMPDNPMTISGFDILKTASNDGNFGNITNYDLGSQNYQNQMGNQWGTYNIPNQNSNTVLIGGVEFPALSSLNSQPSIFNNNSNNSFYGQLCGSNTAVQQTEASGQLSMQGGAMGALAGLGLAAVTGGAALPLAGIGALIGSGVAGNALEGLGNFQQLLGQGMKGLGNLMEMPFQKVGDLLGKIPLVGGLLGGATKLAGSILSAPMKLTGAVTEIGGKIVSGIGKAVNKVGKVLKKL